MELGLSVANLTRWSICATKQRPPSLYLGVEFVIIKPHFEIFDEVGPDAVARLANTEKYEVRTPVQCVALYVTIMHGFAEPPHPEMKRIALSVVLVLKSITQLVLTGTMWRIGEVDGGSPRVVGSKACATLRATCARVPAPGATGGLLRRRGADASVPFDFCLGLACFFARGTPAHGGLVLALW